MRKILITGAAGFIGFHLARKLHSLGEQIACIDNFNSYYDPTLKEARAKALQNLGIVIEKRDITDSADLEHWIDRHQPTHLIHLAAQAGVRYSLANPHTYMKSNMVGFLNILEACRHRSAIKLVYASSSSVYGNNTKTPFSIHDPTDSQASLYGVTKKSNELMASTYHHLFQIPVIGLRFFTVYGPWGRPDMAYYLFTDAILNDKPIDVYNHGNLLRDFTYIDDIIDGIQGALKLEKGCHLFNLGNNKPIELNKFIAVLEGVIGKKAVKNFLPEQKGDVQSTFADIKESEKVLGFKPKTFIEDGLSKFVDWYKRYHGKE